MERQWSTVLQLLLTGVGMIAGTWSVVLGAALIGWAVLLFVRANHHSICRGITNYVGVGMDWCSGDLQQTTVEASSVRPAQPQPDWALGELLRGLHPNPLDDANWLAVGNEVRDAASLGKIQVWGRFAVIEQSSASEATKSALIKVEADYWKNAQFNWATILETKTHLPQTVPLPHKCHADFTRYNDLYVNKAQCIECWPRRLQVENVPRQIPQP
ncbi:MAG: hypothetical protein NW216_11835 [Hyphomicrobium sp.]|nr:hypothetical protein [Hyphomicrobium sp.]